MGSSKADVAVSYDVSNEFFRLWLDERMNYTCGLFDDGPARTPTEQRRPGRRPQAAAWRRRARRSAAGSSHPRRVAHLGRDSSLLDIGCGWGANIEYQSDVTRRAQGARHHALAQAQHAEIERARASGRDREACATATTSRPRSSTR